MSELSGRRIILGVTGSIAAYKSAVLAREIVKRGAEIRVAMTPAASHFIAPLTFASISRFPVAITMYPQPGHEPEHGSWHIEWGTWSDAMVIAPASAATIAKLAIGLSDNALTVIATALRGKLFIAPAMDSDMYRYPALGRNLATLRSFGIHVLPVGSGDLASGLTGPGRMAEPDEIIDALERHFGRRTSLRGRHVLVTAGPTHESIDPVRYISNRSSGRMGYALAEEARDRGAQVTLVSGPTSLADPYGVDVIRVTTADQMANAVDSFAPVADIVIAAAAVADFTPSTRHDRKMKRRDMEAEEMRIELRPTRDILGSLGEQRRDGQIVVGFALETATGPTLIELGRRKLIEKNCDLIVANSAIEEGAGFDVATNRVILVHADHDHALPMLGKHECAAAILDDVEAIMTCEPQSSRTDATVEHE